LLAGRYRLEELLGGTDAEVYRATDEQLGRTVAVKIARPLAAGFEHERFGNETRVLAALRHPALVTLYDAGSADGAPYLVMQYVAGSTLAARLRGMPPPEEEIRRIGSAVAGALAYLHSRGVVHRDVKPANVLLGEGGEVYLADLGIARAADTAGLTATGMVVGTPAYLAPEQVAGLPIGPACDVYSLGLVLLECFTGTREYLGTPVEAALARLSRQPVVPIGLPAPWSRLLAELTAADPAARPDAGEVAARLAADPQTEDIPAAIPSRRPRAAVLVVLGAVVLGAGAVATARLGAEPGPAAPRPVGVVGSTPSAVPISTAPPVSPTTVPARTATARQPAAGRGDHGGPGHKPRGQDHGGDGD
jgi:serine/threonine protein kinase